MDNSLPLAGIVVLSIEQAIAAPLCTRQLADLGARVIKIERRDTGDFARDYDTRASGLSSHFVWTNRSKESVTLDIKHNDAPSILSRLLLKADVLVQNLAPSAAARVGLSFDALKERYPSLIVCNITGYGKEGPYANKKAYDLLVQAEAGFLAVTGTQQDRVKSGISIADIAAGTQAHGAILAAIIKRGKSGEGCEIDISMLEAMVEWMGFPLLYASNGASAPERTGTDHASIYPYGEFAVGEDRSILLGVQNDREWRDFCEIVLEKSELASVPEFMSNERRSKNRLRLKQLIEQELLLLNVDQLCVRLDQARIAFAFVNDLESVWQHPQLTALQRLVDTQTPAGILKTFLPPGNNSSFSSEVGAVPSLGQHTADVLNELGFSQNEIDRFFTDKVC